MADAPPKAPALTDAQKERLKERDRLGEQSKKLETEGKLVEAIAAAESKLAIERDVLGEASEDAIGSLDRMARLHEARDDWPSARAACVLVLAARSGTLGKEHWKSVDARFGLVRIEMAGRLDREGRRRFAEGRALVTNLENLYSQGRYVEATQPARQALELNREVLGERHPEAIASLSNLAQLLQLSGDFDAARPMQEQALRLHEEVLGERHPATINSLNNTAQLLVARGDLDAAEPMLERALRLCEGVLGERHVETIGCLNNLGSLLWTRGNFDSARPILERALRLSGEVMGERHPFAINCLDNLAVLLSTLGDSAAARTMLERALRLREEIMGDRHPTTITTLNNLASLAWIQGDFDTARPIMERTLRLREEVLGDRHPDTINSLGTLGSLLTDLGDLGGARPILERALRLAEEVLGERNADTIGSMLNLAYLLRDQGDLEAARPLSERAVRLSGEVLGERHYYSINSLENMASLLRDRGDLEAARPLQERAIRLRAEVLGDRHSDTINGLNNLVVLLRAQGDDDAARATVGRSLAASSARLASSLPSLTGREQLALIKASRFGLDLSLGLSSSRPEEAAAAYVGLLDVKGLVAEAEDARRLANRPEARELRSRLTPLRSRLNALAYAQVPADRLDGHARSVRALADDIAAVELALARAVDWRPRRPEAAHVAASLPESACLVDLFRYQHVPGPEPGKPRTPAQDRYVAFVVRPGAAPARVELGPAEPIDEALASWQARLEQGGEAEGLGREVARLAWAPLVPHLGDARAVLISPDGDLAFLPWAALPDADPGSCLLRRFAFAVVPSARQLVALAERGPVPAPGGLLAVGGVDYGREEPGEPIAVTSRSAAVGRSALAFGALPGTEREARAVAALHSATHPDAPAVEALAGAGATKGRLAAAMPGKRFLHLATHGYFAPPGFKNVLAPEDDRTTLKSGEGMGRAEVTGFYPGLLSGLVWAGAASPKIDPLSGSLDVGAALMTAEEVGGIDLKGCEMAVLSACETGLGRTAGGEGVLGLQRSFLQAGARTVVASLWKVDDDATRELMTRFYKNVWEAKMPPLEALRQAQLSILDDPNFGDGGNPQLWAAWTLSGDPGGLRRTDPPAHPRSDVKK